MNRVLLRDVPGGLAVAAVLSLGLLAPSAEAACGQPAQPAVYTTVAHPAVTETQAAVTHSEWLWTRDVATTWREAASVDPGYDVLRWSRTTEVREIEYAEKVVDRPYVAATPGSPAVWRTETVVVAPAVTMTLWEYLHMTTGETKWKEEGWNAGPGGKGWSATGATDLVEITPAVTEEVQVLVSPAVPGTPEVPEASHLKLHWLGEGASAPAGWTATGRTHVASSSTETTDLPEGQQPEGDGWILDRVVDTVADVVETRWLAPGEETPAGFDETGQQETRTTSETTAARSASEPDGDGWSRVTGSEVVVVDQAERVVQVAPAWTEQVMVSPAVPATGDCPATTVNPPAAGAGGVVAAPAVDAQAPVPAAVPAAVLPATGSDVPSWVPLVGISSLAAGMVLVRRGRAES